MSDGVMAYPPVDSLRSLLRSPSENAGALAGNVTSHAALFTRDLCASSGEPCACHESKHIAHAN